MGKPDPDTKLTKSRPRVFVRPSRVHRGREKPWIEMDAQVGHHLRKVLRLGPGAKIIVIDGTGREYLCQLTEAKPSRVTAAILESSTPNVESPLKITLAQSLPKTQAFDRILTGCTELGVTRFAPLTTSRSVVKVTKKDITDKVKRWQTIVESSCAQSERVAVPRVEYPATLEDWLGSDSSGLKIILWERSYQSADMEWLNQEPRPEEVTLLAGPEGGFEQSEVQAALDAGYKPMSLGPRILRAETAAATAVAILQHRLGDG